MVLRLTKETCDRLPLTPCQSLDFGSEPASAVRLELSVLMAIQTLFGTPPADFPSPDGGSLPDRLKAGIQKPRSGLMEKLEDAVSGRKEIDADVLEELEYALITADIGAKTTAEILERIRQQVDRSTVGDIGELKTLIREHLLEILRASERDLPQVAE